MANFYDPSKTFSSANLSAAEDPIAVEQTPTTGPGWLPDSVRNMLSGNSPQTTEPTPAVPAEPERQGWFARNIPGFNSPQTEEPAAADPAAPVPPGNPFRDGTGAAGEGVTSSITDDVNTAARNIAAGAKPVAEAQKNAPAYGQKNAQDDLVWLNQNVNPKTGASNKAKEAAERLERFTDFQAKEAKTPAERETVANNRLLVAYLKDPKEFNDYSQAVNRLNQVADPITGAMKTNDPAKQAQAKKDLESVVAYQEKHHCVSEDVGQRNKKIQQQWGAAQGPAANTEKAVAAKKPDAPNLSDDLLKELASLGKSMLPVISGIASITGMTVTAVAGATPGNTQIAAKNNGPGGPSV
jgi:hypothetical protein